MLRRLHGILGNHVGCCVLGCVEILDLDLVSVEMDVKNWEFHVRVFLAQARERQTGGWMME